MSDLEKFFATARSRIQTETGRELFEAVRERYELAKADRYPTVAVAYTSGHNSVTTRYPDSTLTDPHMDILAVPLSTGP
ncbi:hypothetical protein ACYJ1Y_09505 [Natrialbaceae archaeon A-gly3]